ncbi:sigma-70 family RNA polymerase sigma factor [Variovorax terrae]|uniref:Sigma-70 family RNA polymerase sigma factor n=1 Tax=Variovorax terrae TaxID=2923278 RepID=A0A9X1VW74_9BURK|nr:sigma-70 family RNA polymerase sigma factor [Variovorax terrae]MCJ0764532.1 sigma-70 family RNA polymerase sigma factor [Variovorax terrae]
MTRPDEMLTEASGDALTVRKAIAGKQEGCVEEELWLKWIKETDYQAREQLVRLYLPYVRIVAATYYAKRLHDEIEFAEYYQLASMGMLEALDRFDPSVGVQFKTFAARRMHGAILNGLEKLTEKQQQIAARKRLQTERRESVKLPQAIEGESEGIGGRGKPGGRAPEQLLRYVADVGLGLALSWMLEGTSMIEAPETSEAIPFYRSAEVKQLRQRIASLIEGLPQQQRTVIRYHYQQEIPFEEIASMLGLTRGRIAQIHKQALMQLREALQEKPIADVVL